ncbi:MAG: hypothetical protein IK109_06785 [Clostridiales bacterium]|nr:hypothetical protein [Clostridiales bacterium]MBR5417718.1 hypothetical protein [Clostridiales bacterium]
MKTVKKMAAIVLVGAMALSIAACKKSAKKVSVDDFKKACEEVGLTVEDLGASDGVKEQYEAANSDGTLDVSYIVCENTDDAKKGFDMISSSADSAKDMGADVSTSSNKVEVSLEGLLYMYAVRNGDTVITVSGSGEEQASTAKDLVKKLGI